MYVCVYNKISLERGPPGIVFYVSICKHIQLHIYIYIYIHKYIYIYTHIYMYVSGFVQSLPTKI